ncbi:hypothetical protein Sfulv_58510 [Streptomyces fulvorobeus]|uniref:HTH hxlR-type domain-containing protein n=1 Tax=Streptomyces fulvorobeus TaxID=284028 RepID=A0A7J0CEW9_9ACTN|nr:hypothetical protein Sfulv_58510 [Streptomyces fulvorobeus]
MKELSTEDERQAAALEFDVFAKHCPSRQVLDHLTGRWGVLVLAGLRKGPVRFNALRRRIDGISEKMLAQTLQALERDGFVSREVLTAMPRASTTPSHPWARPRPITSWLSSATSKPTCPQSSHPRKSTPPPLRGEAAPARSRTIHSHADQPGIRADVLAPESHFGGRGTSYALSARRRWGVKYRPRWGSYLVCP